MVSERRKNTSWQIKKRHFVPFKVHYCLLNNILILVFVNNFEPNPVLVRCNPNLGFATKARACKGVGQEGSPGVTSHAPRNVGECEGMNHHTPK